MEAQQMYGTIFDIQRMSLHDGPGIRTTVFFKGCTMHCFWCHNPESLSSDPDIQFFAGRCIGCRLCRTVCRRHCHQFMDTGGTHLFVRKSCTMCGKCADICPSGSLVITGSKISLDDLIGIVSRDKAFFNHAGGVTASGGEPLLQAEYVARFFMELKGRGIHTAMETALNVPPEALQKAMPYTDLFLADLKHPDSQVHKDLTGCLNDTVLYNISLLDNSGLPYCIRIPVIPGINDTIEVMRTYHACIRQLKNPLYLELMPYHAYGIVKYNSLSMAHSRLNTIHPPLTEDLIHLAKCFDNIKVLIRNGANEITITGGIIC